MSKRCPKCGSILADDSAFCNKCGAKLNDLCPKCGNQLPQGARFCNKCGYSLDGSANKNEAGSAIRQWAATKQSVEQKPETPNGFEEEGLLVAQKRMAFSKEMRKIGEDRQKALKMHVKPVAFILPLAICGGFAYLLFVIAISLVASGIPWSYIIPVWVFAALFAIAVIIFLPFAIKMIKKNKQCNAILRDCEKRRKEALKMVNDPNYKLENKTDSESEIPIMY